MFELLLGIGVCVVIAKIADGENLSGALWFSVAFLCCCAAIFIPLPYLRFLIAGAAAFGMMIVYRVIAKA